MAMDFCRVVYDVPKGHWEAYLIVPDEKSCLMLNGEPVSFAGWKYELPDETMLHLHRERKVIEF